MSVSALLPLPLAATLVDTVGTAALVTVSRRSGVSLNINVDYLRGMPGGGDVLVEAKVGEFR
jgi:acyl-coenzyme A thioesterase PaaI-like protein